MKKTYIKPSMRTAEIETHNALMAGSDGIIGYSGQDANPEEEVLTKRQSIWDQW